MTLLPEHLSKIVARYAFEFRSAWRLRDTLDPPHRTADELAYLPAHMELIETPVNPVPNFAIWTLIAVFLTALAWACFGYLDIVAVAPGKTVLGGRTKIVQPLEPAVVKAIRVSDGQRVKAGEVLIELDSSFTSADERKARSALSSALGNKARLVELSRSVERGSPPARFEIQGAAPEDVETQNRLAASEYAAYSAKIRAYESDVRQRAAELSTTRASIEHLEEGLKIVVARERDVAQLATKKFVSEFELLQIKESVVAAERQLDIEESRCAELIAAAASQRSQLVAAKAEFKRQLEEGLRQSEEQLAQIAQDVRKTSHRNGQTSIRSPVSGTVQELAIHTTGGVVVPAQKLLSIVPSDDQVEVQAMILNRDVGFIRAGQKVVVKLETFPYTRFGVLAGEVVSVSRDALQDEKLGLVFEARIRISRSQLAVNGHAIRLSSGMALTAEIKTGRRRVVEYLLGPIAEAMQESLRER